MELTTKRRKRLRKTSFGLPKKRKYPIDTEARARSALARVSQHGTSSEKQRVIRAVKKRYPKMNVTMRA